MTTIPDDLNQRGANGLPGHLGIVVTAVAEREIRTTLQIRAEHMAPNGYLHAGTVVSVADTSCGYGCMANKPNSAVGFTTIELKSNHLGTARDGHIDCVARVVHAGRTTQVWDAELSHRESGKTIALFRCTQMILYP